MEKREYESRIKELEKEIKVIKERYRILVETTPALLFEYKTDEDKMIFIYNFPDNKSRREITEYHKFMQKTPLVHPEHLDKFMEVLKRAGEMMVRGEIEYLSKVSSDEFEWHRTYYSSIEDESGRIIGVVGRIQNIHDSVTEKQDMLHRVETDFLTGLYNKGAATKRIAEWLKDNPTRGAHLIMLDLDNFKSINDRYGHAYGDEILKETARLLLQSFGVNSLISRFGGDEFITFVIDEPIRLVESRVDTMMQRLAADVPEIDVPLNCSVGITARVSRQDEFEDLFNRADNAMYQAKKAGKNCYYVYKNEE